MAAAFLSQGCLILLNAGVNALPGFVITVLTYVAPSYTPANLASSATVAATVSGVYIRGINLLRSVMLFHLRGGHIPLRQGVVFVEVLPVAA